MTAATPIRPKPSKSRRGFWLRQLHRWHWISSATCLMGMLLFAITGITLNHAGDISAEPVTATKSVALDQATAATLASARVAEGEKAPIPDAARAALKPLLSTAIPAAPAEWSADEIFLELPRPGGDATLTIDRATGEAVYETTDRGWIAYLNDLHKGRNTGPVWSWFIDIFAVACLVFSITGLFLLQLHSKHRPSTWPIVGFGLLVPVVLAILFIH